VTKRIKRHAVVGHEFCLLYPIVVSANKNVDSAPIDESNFALSYVRVGCSNYDGIAANGNGTTEAILAATIVSG
jgi:hypothetical protein